MPRQKNPTPPPVNGHDTTQDDPDAGIVVDDAAAAGAEVETAAPHQADDEGVRSLTAQLEAANRRADAAEAERTRLASERSKDQTTIADSRLLVIDSTIKTNETKLDSVKKRIREAKEAGDYDAETNATSELAEITLDLKQARMGKDRLEQMIEEAKTAPREPVTEEEKFEAWSKANNVSPQSKSWLKGHMDYLRDPLKQAELQLAHQKALRSGTEPNSDEYFAAVEKELGLGSSDAPVREERRQAAPAAPVSRGTDMMGTRKVSPVPGITDLGNGKYKVSREVAEAAAMAGIPVKKYVEEALKLERGSDGQLH